MAGPSLAGYTTFIRTIMNISTAVLPSDSPAIPGTYNQSLNWVNPKLALAPTYGDPAFPSPYAEAVYNLAGDRLINFAPDVDGASPVAGSEPPMPYFAFARKQFKINALVSGMISGASDQGTSSSLVVPGWAEKLTIGDIQNMKTPWGRNYINIAQQFGNLWGLTP